VSAGGEFAEPAGEVDSCLEQAANSASEPTHNNRTLRFIRSPHYCNGTVTGGPSSVDPTQGGESQVAFRCRCIASRVSHYCPATPMLGACSAGSWGAREPHPGILRVSLKEPCV
jgi:hypothetical protein